MSEQSQIAPISGSMNRDVHPKRVRTDDGMVYKRTNLRTSSTDGNAYINKKLKGTLHVPAVFPAGTNKVIGWCNDTKNNGIVYFVHNSNNNHCVMRYLTKTKALQRIWYSQPDLGLIDDVLRAQVVENKVYWVNASESPKSFNLEYAYNYTNGVVSDEKYTAEDMPFADNIFSLAKKPPQYAPRCSYDSDTSVNFNNLRKRLFQFKYAYQYYDDQISAWSSISKVPLPQDEIGASGEYRTDITVNNIINVVINTGTKAVKKILVAAMDTYPRNAGSFFKFETIEKYNKDTGEQLIGDDSEHIVPFYNNKITERIDTEINNRYCDFVPLSGDDIGLLDGKYLGIARPEEGYDGIVPDYSLFAVEEEIDFDIATVSMTVTREFRFLELLPKTYDVIYIPTTFYRDSMYVISFRVNNKNYLFSITTTDSYAGYPTSMRDAFRNQMVAEFADEPGINGVLLAPIGSTGIAMKYYANDGIFGNTNPYDITNLQGTITTNVGSFIPAYKSLKKGQYHPFGIIYNDDYGRYNIVYANNELYVPVSDDDPLTDNPQKTMCSWQIRHRPPDWATAYRWCYLRNKSYTYFQYFAHVKATVGEGLGAGQNKIPAGKRLLELNQSLQRIRDAFPNFILSDYEWQNGDRVRILGDDQSYEVLAPYTWVDEDDPESGVNGFLVSSDFPYLSNHVLLEVYRQNPTPQERIYLEIGEEYPILDPGTANRRHKGQFSDQNAALTVPATGILDFGDIYLRYRLVVAQTGVSGAMAVEDEYYNDYYRSDAIDVGRAGAKIDAKNKVLNRVTRSENYIENTEYNQLNVWLPATDYFDASDEFGKITGIEGAGDVLKVIQEHKETSIYVGRNAVKQADGNNIVLATDKVFGTANRYVEFRGTTYRRSLVSNKRYLYYFDESTGEFVRSSPNGQAPISSDYGMHSYFENKAKELREYTGSKDVITGINNDYDEVFVSFIIGDSIETVVFSEEENNKGWKFFVTLYKDTHIIQNQAFFGDQLFSFLNGQFYVHDMTDNYNKFFGKQHDCNVEFFVNKFATATKRFKNIRISTNKNIWDVEFSIPEGLNYGNQKSILKPTILRSRSNQVVSDILRNIIGKTGIESVNLLHNGERMIGEYMKVDIQNQDGTDAELREVEVKFLISS